jgi:hypothetical protein
MGESMDLGLCTLHLNDPEDMLAWVDSQALKAEGHVLLISRLPQRGLLEHVHLDKLEAHWLTNHDVAGSIQPSVEAINSLLTSRFAAHEGLAVLEGLEWLISLHGLDEVLRMVMKLADSLHRKPWRLVLALDTGVLDQVGLKRLYREAPAWSMPTEETISVPSAIEEVSEEASEAPLSEDSESKLAFLTRLPRNGFTPDILRRRILQWRRMGLDVSEVEPAMFDGDLDRAFELYKVVEDKVRTAIELDNRLDILYERGVRSEVVKMRFRVRQLTGFGEVEARINELI